MRRRKGQCGSAIIEFVLTGIPLLFIWISIVQMSLGMWNYHTLQYAIKQTAAYVAAHGSGAGYCRVNNCRVQDAAAIMSQYAIGIRASSVTMTFTTVGADHVTKIASTTCALDACQTNANNFPAGQPEFEILAEYQFKNAISMVGPGKGGVIQFKNPWFPAYTHEQVMY